MSSESYTPTLSKGPVGGEATLPGDGTILRNDAHDDEDALSERYGRFAVRGVLGRGGMSIVLEAYDEALEREIALKVLHRGTSSARQERLVGEAQALARLSHPHVVQVYEVGEAEGQTFIAMELVRGQTLGQWQQQRPPWKECVELYLQAGRGLAAAHAVGLVHRDFKPSNCIVDERGQVRVLDFGLARERRTAQEPAPTTDSEHAHADVETLPATSMTQTGAVLGTLAYMPLEQLEGKQVDERSDQFSFCVSLYQALYGERPFDDSSVGTLTAMLVKGEVRPPPSGRSVPNRLRRVLLRGLSVYPDQRWPSMEALLAELRRLIRARRAGFAATVLGSGLAVLGGLMWQRGQVDERCAGGRAQLDDAWDVERAARVEQTLVATGLPFAADTWARIEPRLFSYADEWVAHYREACEATRLRGEQTEDALGLRMACLSTRRIALRETAGVLVHADADVLPRAVEIVAALPDLERCADVEALSAEIPPPDDSTVAARVDELREQLVVISALVGAGRYDDADTTMTAISGEIEALGYPPLQAEAAVHRGEIEANRGRYAESEAELVRAYALALEHGHEQVGAEASRRLVTVVGVEQARFAEGRQWGITAMALANREGTLARTEALDAVGVMALAEGEHQRSRARHEEALALRERLLETDHPAIAQSLLNLGRVAQAEGRLDEAHDHLQRALEIQHDAYGSAHPQLAATLLELATNAQDQGHIEQALEHQRRALELQRQALGPEHPSVARSLTIMGVSLGRQERFDEAIETYQRAEAITTKSLGPRHPSLGAIRLNLGTVLERRGRHAEALEQYREVEPLLVESMGAEHPNVAILLDNMGASLQGLEQWEQARVHHERALEIKRKTLRPQHPDIARSLGNLGRVLLMQGKPDEALELQNEALEMFEALFGAEHVDVGTAVVQMAMAERDRGGYEACLSLAERGVAIFESNESGVAQRGSSRMVLAQCLWEARPRERARALELAEQAEALVAESEAKAQWHADLDAWLAERRHR